MTSIERSLSTGMSVLALGLLGLRLGLILIQRRPMLIKPQAIWLGGVLVLAPMFVTIVYRLVIESLSSSSVILNLAWSLLGILVILLLYLPFLLFIGRGFWALNVSENMLLSSLQHVLEKRDIDFSLSRDSSSLLSQLYGLPRFIFQLPQSETLIVVRGFSLGRASLRFVRKRNLTEFDAFLSDFKQVLHEKDYRGDTIAFPLLFVAAALIAGGLYGIFIALSETM